MNFSLFKFLLLVLTLTKITNSMLVWISMDGFRNDYLSEEVTPYLYGLSTKAVVSTVHKPVFQSKSLPNQFSQATGLYANKNGILADRMLEGEDFFNVSTTDINWWDPDDSIRPLWVINQENEGNSSVLFWTGADLTFGGVKPTFSYPENDDSHDTHSRLSTAYDQIVSGEFNLVMVSLKDAVLSGHIFGPESKERKDAVRNMDKEIGLFMTKLNLMKNETYQQINFMFSSDHGMAEILSENVKSVDELFPELPEENVVNQGPVFEVETDVETAQSMKEMLLEQDYVAKAFLRDELPKNYYYNHPTRTPQLVVEAKEGYSITYKSSYNLKGDSGYSIETSPQMQGVFMTLGPKVNLDASLEESTQPDLFLVACHFIELDSHCTHSDGSLPRKIFNDVGSGVNLGMAIGIPVAVVVLLVIIGVVVYMTVFRNKKSKGQV